MYHEKMVVADYGRDFCRSFRFFSSVRQERQGPLEAGVDDDALPVGVFPHHLFVGRPIGLELAFFAAL